MSSLNPPNELEQRVLDAAGLVTEQVWDICKAFAKGSLDEKQKNPHEVYQSKALGTAYDYGREQTKAALAALAERQSKGPR
jgi:hypothetical protein